MPVNKQQHGLYFAVTAEGATATATQTAIAGSKFYITDVAGSSDKAGSFLIVKQGSTTIWKVQLQTSAAGFPAFQQSFQQPLEGIVGGTVSVTVDGTTTAEANICGFSLPTL